MKFIGALFIVILCSIRQDNENLNLQWEYFQGTKPQDSPYVAFTKSFPKLKMENGHPVFPLQFCCAFSQTKSWVDKRWLDTVSESNKLQVLHHEEGHHKIAAIVCKVMQSALESHRYPLPDSIKPFTKFLDSMSVRMDQLNLLYDAETHHGTFLPKQQLWNDSIAKLLDQLTNSKICVVREWVSTLPQKLCNVGLKSRYFWVHFSPAGRRRLRSFIHRISKQLGMRRSGPPC